MPSRPSSPHRRRPSRTTRNPARPRVARATAPCENCGAPARIASDTGFEAPECDCTTPAEHRRRGTSLRHDPTLTPHPEGALTLCANCQNDDWSHCGMCGRWMPVGVQRCDAIGDPHCPRCRAEHPNWQGEEGD